MPTKGAFFLQAAWQPVLEDDDFVELSSTQASLGKWKLEGVIAQSLNPNFNGFNPNEKEF